MTQHTKGPWNIYVSDVLGSVEVGAKQEPFCHLTRHSKDRTDNREANARLIAAAPEMYSALETILFGLTDDVTNNDGKIDFAALVPLVQSTLKKARGE